VGVRVPSSALRNIAKCCKTLKIKRFSEFFLFIKLNKIAKYGGFRGFAATKSLLKIKKQIR